LPELPWDKGTMLFSQLGFPLDGHMGYVLFVNYRYKYKK
jgi:hypothetical protein